MSLLTPDFGLFIWMLLSFGVVFFVLAKYGFPVIVKMVEDRKSYIDKSVISAREANEQLAHVKSESAALIAAADKEQGRIMREAAEEREKIILDARKKAQESAEKELAKAKIQLQKEKDEAIREIRRQVATMSVDIAEMVIRKNLSTQEDQMAMIDRMLEDYLQRGDEQA
ncbi:MAG: F0F1 ATP synthase subunit B [Prevotellaceae bacterium]|jgi:F-type H+-transporting ATPase subunit b|nr:F0F1 ATP synthase subunit B [Prevotellaceae bacterium]